jgi:hypothetical protein
MSLRETIGRWPVLGEGSAGRGRSADSGREAQGGAAGKVGAALILAGTAFERFAVLRAGNLSARDPRYTVAPQRARIDERDNTPVRSVT